MKPLVIVRQPFGRRGAPETHRREVGEVLSEVLIELSPSRWGGQHVDVYHNAYAEDARVPIQKTSQILLSEDDRYYIDVLPSGLLALGGFASNFLVSTAVGFGLSFLSQALRPTPWVGPGAAARTKPTPINQLDPPRNQPRLGSRIPDLYGAMRSWPDLIYPPYEEWTNGSGDGNPGRVQELQSIYCVSQGDCDLEEFYVGDTPIEAIEGAVVTILKPGDPIPSSFYLVQSNSVAQNVQLFMPQEWPDPSVGDNDGWSAPDVGWTSWFRLPQGDILQIWSQFSFPNGALASEFKYGTSGPYNHRVTIQYRRIDPVTGAVVEGPFQDDASFWNRTTSPLRLTRRTTVPTEGLWEVRYRREDNLLTREFDPGLGVDQFNRGIVLVEAQGFSVLEADQRVNDTTRVHLQFTNLSPSAQVSVNAQSRFNVVAKRRLPVIDLDLVTVGPEAQTVRWVDAIYHMLRDPLIGNYPAAEIDLESLALVQKIMESRTLPSDEFPGEYNAVWDSVVSVDEQISATARAARASLFSDGSQVIAAVDADNRIDENGIPRNAWEIVTALFSRRNRSNQDLDAGISMRAALPTENDGVEIQWIDRASNWQRRTFVYTPSGSPTALRPIRVEAVGLTSFEQVWRHAQYIFNRSLFRRKTTTLNVFEEARLLSLWDTVQVVQPWREIKTDGQILEYDNPGGGIHWVTLDEDVSSLTTFEDTIRIRSTDGTRSEIFDIIDVDVPANRVRLGVRDGVDPHIDIQLGIPTTQIGNLFQIATDATDQADQWLVLGVSGQTYEGTVTLTNSDNRVFDGDVLALPGDPGLPHTPPRTPPSEGQHPCLTFWYWPEVDEGLGVRRTRTQTPFDLRFATMGLGDNFGESGRGYRSRAVSDQDVLDIVGSNVQRDYWDWWIQADTGEQPTAGIFYWHLELTADVLTQPNARYFWMLRRLATELYGLIIRATGEIEFVRASGGATASTISEVVLTPIATEYIIACTYDGNSNNQYAYVGEPLISPGTSVRREGSDLSRPSLGGDLNCFMASGNVTSNSPNGTFYLREFRHYNCIPDEQFVADLAAGLRTEVPL